jgi:phospholipase/carboxylesterase
MLQAAVVGERGPVVVMLHGFGAPGDDLVGLAEIVEAPCRWVFPAAPLSLPWGGQAWWMIDMARLERAIATGEERDLTNDVPAGLAEARESMVAFLDEVDRRIGPVAVLGGFSQGAMLALDVALRTPRPLKGLALLSGTLLAAPEWKPLMPARKGLKILQSHGRYDQLLPFRVATELRDALTSAGAHVEFIDFPGGHEIPPKVLDRLDVLIRGTNA